MRRCGSCACSSAESGMPAPYGRQSHIYPGITPRRRPCPSSSSAVTIVLMADDAMHVYLEIEASPEEVAAVEQALREAGIDAPVEATYERRGVGDFPWILEISGAA